MTDTKNAPSQVPPLRPLYDQASTALAINEGHRRHLVERIAQIRAMSDDRLAEAETYKRMGPDAAARVQASEVESKRLNDQAEMLTQRVHGLLAELYVSSSMAPAAAPAPRLPWQRPVWWEQLATAAEGLTKLATAAELYEDKLGPHGREAALSAASLGQRALSLKPEDLSTSSMEPARILQSAIEKVAPMPWHLVDVDAQSGAQLVQLLQHLCDGVPPIERLPAPQLAECRRLFGVVLDSMQSHPEIGRLEAAAQHFEDDNRGLAASILAGLAPPDLMRYEVNVLTRLVSSLA